MNRKGFTLIELLGVIVIIGILLSLTIFGATNILINARKSVYVSNAREFLKTARIEIMKDPDRFPIDEIDTTYYIHYKRFQMVMDKEYGSPFGDWKEAYVVAVIDENKNLILGWASQDVANYTVRTVPEVDLDRDDVVQDSRPLNKYAPLGTRDYVSVIDRNGQMQSKQPQSLELSYEEADECFSYEPLSGNRIKITYYKIAENPKCGVNVVIPGVIGNKQVTEIYYYSFYQKGIESVVIPHGVTTIGDCVFQKNHLKRVVLPETLTSIGTEAFDNNEIPEIIFPSKLMTLGARSFRSNQIHSYDLPDSVETVGTCAFCNNPLDSPDFMYKKGDDSVIIGFNGDLSYFVETYNKKLFYIPDKHNGTPLKTIEDGAFKSLNMDDWTVHIPDTVTTIGYQAFWYDHIKEVDIFSEEDRSKSQLQSIGSYSFYYESLTKLNIPDSVTYIGPMAFNRNLVTNGDVFIYERTASGINYSKIIGYAGSGVENLTIPATAPDGTALKELGDRAFQFTFLRGTVTIPQSVTSIGKWSFALNLLDDVNNGPGDTEIKPFVYKRDSTKTGGYDKTVIISYGDNPLNNKKKKVYTVNVPDGVTTIGEGAFFYSQISNVNFPDSLTTIGNKAFETCRLRGTIVIPPKVTSIGAGAFAKANTWTCLNCDIEKFVNKTGKAFPWKSIISGTGSAASFETGTATSWYGDVEITKS